MPAINVTQALQMAAAAHHRRQWTEAEKLYRQVLSADARQADALHLYGLLLHQTGRTQAGVELIRQAISLNPRVMMYHSNLALVHCELRQFAAAAECLHHASALDPSNIELRLRLAHLLNNELSRPAEAAAEYKAFLAIQPESVPAIWGLARALERMGEVHSALDHYRRARELAPQHVDILSDFAGALRAAGELEQCVETSRVACAIAPGEARLWYNLGVAHMSLQATEPAIAALQKSLQLNPNDLMAQVNMAATLNARGDVNQAVELYAKLIEKHPEVAELRTNLGLALQSQGRLKESIAALRQAVALNPDGMGVYDNLLMGLHYDADLSAASIFSEHQQWGERIAVQIPARQRSRETSANRRLCVGYVSPDFRQHSVSYFIEPVVVHHDRRAIEVFCYANQPITDETTRRMRGHADHWRNIYTLSDDAAADIIEKDQIDILVDLAAHTHANRLKIFARKPARLQVTWLGYAGTTGLTTIDFRLTDPWVDPPGASEAYHTEKLLRLPDTQWVYSPPKEAGDVSPLPAEANGHVTFGVATNFAKLNDASIAMCSEVLRAIPSARFIIKAGDRIDVQTQRSILDRFVRSGAGENQIQFEQPSSLAEYFEFFSRIDLILDTFPFAGGTTSCHALYMGVPMITRTGDTSVSRVGASLLHNVGLPELIAESAEQFVQKAVALAGDVGRLAKIRGGLRSTMQRSPLMDGQRFVRNLEAAYREIWRQSGNG